MRTRTHMTSGRGAAVTVGVAAAFLTLTTSGPAFAEATYGYSDTGSGPVVATARVNFSVTIPKLILLRIGGDKDATTSLIWTMEAAIPPMTTAPTPGNSHRVEWDGAAPPITPTSQPPALHAYAWSNAGTTTLDCSVAPWSPTSGAGTPPNSASFSVLSSGALQHPGSNLGTCAPINLPSNTALTGTWTYALGAASASWTAGTYSTTVTYTATGL